MVRRCRSDVGRAKPSVAIGAVKYIAQMDSRRNMLLILERRNYGQEATGSYLKAIDSYLQPTAAINNDPQ